jgi:ABC-2 type transport system permease protein
MAFGFTRGQMMTYVFMVLVFMSFVVAAPSIDNMGSEISNGDLSNFLVKPINYLFYWLVRDWASKLLNTIFVFFEIGILWFIFRPQLVFPPNLIVGVISIAVLIIAALIYYLITKLAIFTAFWAPENTWGMMFLILVLLEILSGATFPLDIVSKGLFNILQFTPFPYLVYFPVAIWIGRVETSLALKILVQALVWLGISYFCVIKIWQKGLKEYSAVGK